MLNMFTLADVADIYPIIQFIPHMCKHVQSIRATAAVTVAEFLKISGDWWYKNSVLYKSPQEKIARC